MKRVLMLVLAMLIICSAALGEACAVEIYTPNDNADGFDIAKVDIAQLIIEYMAKTGALPEGTQLISFAVIRSDDGEDIGYLDLSAAFGEAVSHTGTAGETMLMGAVVNTFMVEYQLDGLMLTCEGNVIETGHAVYDEILTMFEG